MNRVALIVAGGHGVRMGSELPKQFLQLGDLPVVMHSIQAFVTYDPDIRILLVLPPSYEAKWAQLVSEFNFEIEIQCVTGGDTRFESVKNGLVHVSHDEIVAIHDGVRPLVSQSV